MPRDPEPLTFTTFPTYRQKLLYEVYNSPRAVLSFDPVKLDLILHYWYVATTFMIYRPCIPSTGPSVGGHVYHRQDCASIAQLTNIWDQGVYVRCCNR